ncbi:MAG: hypothetical protein E7017_00135 [Alphaproteobacteria bacterium]|nr:hypothetical protein [Alphaproteobacteria bacterium]
MFKGIIALFTSGIIFNPFVMMGIGCGVWAIINLPPEDIRTLFLDCRLYIIVAIVAVIYTFLFAKIYKQGGRYIDWNSTMWLAVWNFVRYFISFVLAMSFVTMISIF